jgi:hypothetical protein
LQVHAQQPQLRHFRNDLAREDRLLIPAGDVWTNMLVNQQAYVPCQLLFSRAQLAVQSGQIDSPEHGVGFYL